MISTLEPFPHLRQDPAVISGRPSQMSAVERLAQVVISHAGEDDASHLFSDLACLIGNELRGDVCSIYLFDDAREWLVLSGTVGLNQECIGQVKMSIQEGLTGLTVRERRPVVIPCQAAQHPCFRYFPEAGEDPYDSFLGVPIVAAGEVIGVLVVQTTESRMFSNDEVGLLVEHGLALGPLICRRPA